MSILPFRDGRDRTATSRAGRGSTIIHRKRDRGRNVFGHENPIGLNWQTFTSEPATMSRVRTVRGRRNTGIVIPSENESGQSSDVSRV